MIYIDMPRILPSNFGTISKFASEITDTNGGSSLAMLGFPNGATCHTAPGTQGEGDLSAGPSRSLRMFCFYCDLVDMLEHAEKCGTLHYCSSQVIATCMHACMHTLTYIHPYIHPCMCMHAYMHNYMHKKHNELLLNYVSRFVVHLNHLPSTITMGREVLSDPVGDILVHVGDRMELC